jgi:hypothetical protein
LFSFFFWFGWVELVALFLLQALTLALVAGVVLCCVALASSFLFFFFFFPSPSNATTHHSKTEAQRNKSPFCLLFVFVVCFSDHLVLQLTCLPFSQSVGSWPSAKQ